MKNTEEIILLILGIIFLARSDSKKNCWAAAVGGILIAGFIHLLNS